MRTLEIKPYDISALPEIEKAIFSSNLGLTPKMTARSSACHSRH